MKKPLLQAILFSLAAAFFLSGCELTVVVKDGIGGAVTSDDGLIDCPGQCSHEYANTDAQVTLTAIADNGYEFSEFENPAVCDNQNDPSIDSGVCRVTMNNNHTVVATFNEKAVPGNQKPVVSIVQPGGEVSGPDLGVVVKAVDPDGSVEHVLLYIDNQLVRRENAPPYEWGTANNDWNDEPLINLSSGTYQLKAVATDNDGAVTSVTLSVTVSPQAPNHNEVVITPSGGSDDTGIIQDALDRLEDGDTLRLNGNFVIRRTLYLPSDFTWILSGSMKLGDKADLDRAGVVGPGFDSRKATAITEKPGGAKNIDMSGGVYYGNAENNKSKGVRLINFIQVSHSRFHDMTILNASDDNFTLGAKCTRNECRNLLSRTAGVDEDMSGNGLTDKGDANKWFDCIAEDCTSDGWTPKCRNSEFYRCIARKNLGPGFGLYARLDGSPQSDSIGAAITGNKFYACEAYDNYRGGISLNISANCGPGAIIRDNFIQGTFHNNRMSGVLFRNKLSSGVMKDNAVDVLVYSNLGLRFDGSPSGIGGGLSVDGTPISGITGTVVGYENAYKTGGRDVHLNSAKDSRLTVYMPDDQDPARLDDGNGSNVLNEIDFSCSESLQTWSTQAYCK